MKKSLILTAFLTVLILSTAAAIAGETVKVGVYMSLSGSNAFGGQLQMDGIKLAQKLKPTVLGKQVELVVVDDKSDKVESARAVQRLVEKDKVCVVIGSYGSSQSLSGANVCEYAHIPMVGTGCTNPLVTQGKKYVFRTCFTDPYQGEVGAKFALRDLKAKTAAILINVAEDYCVGLAKDFENVFTAGGGKIVAKLGYQKDDQDFSAQLNSIIAEKPDLLYLPANLIEGATIIRQSRELDAKFKILSGDTLDNPEIFTLGGSAVEGLYSTTFSYDKDMKDMRPAAKKFTEEWNKTFPQKDPSATSACAFDSFMALMMAIEKAGNDDPEKITAALAILRDYDGVTGTISINPEHNVEAPIGIVQISGGKRLYLTTIQHD